jgi:hypothetical protein
LPLVLSRTAEDQAEAGAGAKKYDEHKITAKKPETLTYEIADTAPVHITGWFIMVLKKSSAK